MGRINQENLIALSHVFVINFNKTRSKLGLRSALAPSKALSYVYSSPRLCIESSAAVRTDKVPTLWLEIELDRNIKSNLSPLPNAQSQTIIRTILRAKLLQTLMQLPRSLTHY